MPADGLRIRWCDIWQSVQVMSHGTEQILLDSLAQSGEVVINGGSMRLLWHGLHGKRVTRVTLPENPL